MPENHEQAPFPLLHPNIYIQPPTPTLLPAYKRLITNLLPISYPPQFYTASLPPFSDSFALLAVWRSDAPKSTTTSTSQGFTGRPSSSSSSSLSSLSSSQKQHQQQQQSEVVIGGIQGRIEHQYSSSSSSSSSASPSASSAKEGGGRGGGGGNNNNNGKGDDNGAGRKVLYIQTLAVLAPYRGLGVGKALLEGLIEMVLKEQNNKNEAGGVVIGEVYAHVWEANEEGVEWYVKRGFVVVGGLVESYYRRLRPQGARVVRRRVGVGDWVRMDK